jgi:hypothetical protein
MNFVKVISTQFDKFKKRLIKVRNLGLDDVQTPFESSPFGLDSNPIEGMVAVYSRTEHESDQVIVGYLNKNQIAEPGESRLFSTDSDGNIVFDIILKNDGTAEIGGNGDNLIRFSPLNSEMESLQTFINTELTKIQTGIVGAGGSYTPGSLDIDISGARIDEVKTL